MFGTGYCQDDESGNRRDEKTSEKRITHRGATTNGRPSNFASEKAKKKASEIAFQSQIWSERQDSNLRPDGPKPPALSTAPRPDVFNYTTNDLFLQVVKSVVKPLLLRILRESRVPKKSVFTRLFGVFAFYRG